MNEFLKRNAPAKIRQVKKAKKFRSTFYCVTFTSKKYSRMPNGIYRIYDNREFTTGIAL